MDRPLPLLIVTLAVLFSPLVVAQQGGMGSGPMGGGPGQDMSGDPGTMGPGPHGPMVVDGNEMRHRHQAYQDMSAQERHEMRMQAEGSGMFGWFEFGPHGANGTYAHFRWNDTTGAMNEHRVRFENGTTYGFMHQIRAECPSAATFALGDEGDLVCPGWQLRAYDNPGGSLVVQARNQTHLRLHLNDTAEWQNHTRDQVRLRIHNATAHIAFHGNVTWRHDGDALNLTMPPGAMMRFGADGDPTTQQRERLRRAAFVNGTLGAELRIVPDNDAPVMQRQEYQVRVQQREANLERVHLLLSSIETQGRIVAIEFPPGDFNDQLRVDLDNRTLDRIQTRERLYEQAQAGTLAGAAYAWTAHTSGDELLVYVDHFSTRDLKVTGIQHTENGGPDDDGQDQDTPAVGFALLVATITLMALSGRFARRR